MKSKLYWTEEKVRAEAAKYATKQAFRKGSRSAHCSALKLGIADDLGFSPAYRNKTDAELLAEASKYARWSDFENTNPKDAHTAASRGLLKDFKFPKAPRFLDDYELFEEAAKYKTRADFARNDQAAYQKARQRGLMDQMFSTYRQGRGDFDSLYVVLAKGVFFNGAQVYKIGVSSARLGHTRLQTLKSASGLEFEVITFVRMKDGVLATQLEKRLHLIGDDPKLISFAGCTEFRALTPEQLAVVLDQISLYSAGNI